MCGIVGLLIKKPAQRKELGRLLLPMFTCMADRGPDSAGLAVYGTPVAQGLRRFNLFVPDRQFNWKKLADRFRDQTGATVELTAVENHAVFVSDVAPGAMRAWLAECDPTPHLLSVGRSIDIYKDEGHPTEIAKRYGFAELSGSHSIAHTRMATESAVSPAHAHPFTAGEDFCLVHNGSLSNPYQLRRMLERRGMRFETDNDTEAACRFIEWRLAQGEPLNAALHTAFAELDGFYTLLIATGDSMTLVRDAFACKPAVVAETDEYVAIASEFRSLAHLPGVKSANIFEPLPEEIYSWQA
ncbi:MAG: class II glutamine amidotransferase [Planctomycetes bacterium]|nr:class II glutamine amidotransferase [Planctomycetota bacterium]